MSRKFMQRWNRGRGSWLTAALVAWSMLACQRPLETLDETLNGPPRHLILITVDTLRADRLGLYGHARDTSPHLDALGADSVVFDRAIAQWPKTGASFASIFTGRYPRCTGLTHRAALRIPDELDTLPRLLQAEGFTTVAVVSNPVLSRELGWDRGFDEYLQTWSETASTDPLVYRKELNAVRVNELALDLVRRHAGASRLFVWIHYSDPHAPYVLPAGEENPFLIDAVFQGAEEQVVDLTDTQGREIPGQRDHRYYLAQYDANIRVADRHIGELLAVLGDELGLLEDALTVFTADHGESLGEHGLFYEHGPLPYNNGSHVPLILHRPRLEPGRVAAPVELVDLLPTLLGWLLPVDAETGTAPAVLAQLEGASLLPVLRNRGVPPGVAFSEAGSYPRHFRSVQDQQWKLVLRPPPQGAPVSNRDFELYDLNADPAESVNLIAEKSDELARLRRLLLQERCASATSAQPQPQRPRGAAEIRALQALGYLDELEEAVAEGEGLETPVAAD